MKRASVVGFLLIVLMTVVLTVILINPRRAPADNQIPPESPTTTAPPASQSPTATPVGSLAPSSTPSVTPLGALLETDMDPQGNEATNLGSIQACKEAAPGDSIPIDITIQDIPASSGAGPWGISGFQFSIVYDPSVLSVVSSDTQQLLASKPGAQIIDMTPRITQEAGSYTVATIDLSGGENITTSGVLARITFQAISPGSSTIGLADPILTAGAEQTQRLTTPLGGEIRVGETCQVG